MLAYPSIHQRPSIFGFNGVRDFVRFALVANRKVPKGTLIEFGEGKVFCFIAVLMKSGDALVTVATSLLYCQRPGYLGRNNEEIESGLGHVLHRCTYLPVRF